jgi:hypothetical protein
MIKRVFVFGIFLLLFANLVIAADEPNLYGAPGGEDAEKIGGAIENYTPINESGEFDPTKFNPLKSKAELRIEAINAWLATNASWLGFFFGMVPALSWVFAINIYLMLFFLALLVFHGEFSFMFLEGNRAKIMGGAVYVVLWMTKSFAWLANITIYAISLFWYKVLPIGFWVAVVGMIIIGGLFIALWVFAPQLMVTLGRLVGANKERRAKAKTDLDREELHKEVEAIRKNSS